ncbi:MAG: type II secretion system F family protein [Nanoarchaeota archaeon]|nr:type II secretion system F family protein [Nanoarchaeota archaeon]
MIGSRLPKRYLESIRKDMVYAGIEIDYTVWAAFFFVYAVGVGGAGLVVPLLLQLPLWVALSVGIGLFTLFIVVSKMLLVLAIDKRASFVEKVLPDLLMLIASNIRSGMSVDKALLLSARREFGPLEKEIKRVSKEAFAGKNFGEALKSITKHIRSMTLERTIELINEGIQSGGEIATLLESTAEDIQEASIIKKEINASVMMYVIFIMASAGVGAPLLYAVSIGLVQAITKFGAVQVPDDYFSQMPLMKMKTVSFGEDFLIIYSLVSLLCVALFSGPIIGLIQKGSEKKGFKYIPLMLGLSIGFFLIARMMVSQIFAGFI